MPYKIVKRGDEYCVVKKSDNKQVACHATRKKAERQIAAINANEDYSVSDDLAVEVTISPDVAIPEVDAENFDPIKRDLEFAAAMISASQDDLALYLAYLASPEPHNDLLHKISVGAVEIIQNDNGHMAELLAKGHEAIVAAFGEDLAVADNETELPDGWRGVIAGLDIPTGDGRYLRTPDGGVRTREYPLTLTLQHVGEGVDIPIGNVERVWVEEGMLYGEGKFDLASEEGRDTARRLADGIVNTVSIHPDQLTAVYALLKEDGSLIDYSLIESEEQYNTLRDEGAQDVVVFQDWRLAGLAVVSIPAYTEARIEPVYGYVRGEDTKQDALVAAVGGQVFNELYFLDPKLTGPTKLTVTEDGHVYGHVALWDSCYQYSGEFSTCTRPPHSPSNYNEFHVHSANIGGGKTIDCGVITYGDGHISRGGIKPSRENLNNVAHQAAKVRAGEDQFGVWVSGEILDSVRDFATDILNSPFSGHWEPNPATAGALDMIGAHIVNVPGFRVSPIVASFGDGENIDGLTLTGWTAPLKADASLDELADAILDRMEARKAQREVDHALAVRNMHAVALASRVKNDERKQRAAALAARLAGGE